MMNHKLRMKVLLNNGIVLHVPSLTLKDGRPILQKDGGWINILHTETEFGFALQIHAKGSKMSARDAMLLYDVLEPNDEEWVLDEHVEDRA